MHLQTLDLRVELAQDVLDAREVFAGVVQAVFSFAATLFVFGHTSGLLEEHTQLFWFCLDDAGNHALSDNRIRTWPQTCAHENVLHVTASHLLVVDVITRAAIACEYALDRDFSILAPLTRNRTAFGVVKHQFDRRTRSGFAIARAIKNHIVHRLAAQLGRFRFTEHPARRIHDV